MNWKALLPAAALLVLLAPSAAFSRNHHYYGNISQNGMMGNGAYYGGNPMVNAGINPYAVAPPMANMGAYGMNALANNYNYGNGMFGYNGMNGMNGMCGHHRRHRRRGLLQSLLNQNGGYGYGYGNMGNGLGYGYGNGYMGNGYGYGNGLTGGIRSLLNRI
ncbi:MAG TPA: hypothetical protein V6C89_18350 [Drouetiella sp.]|jgi:hypothetical protein